jgi:non-reducing end alpha-L-arabinofuranosidase
VALLSTCAALGCGGASDASQSTIAGGAGSTAVGGFGGSVSNGGGLVAGGTFGNGGSVSFGGSSEAGAATSGGTRSGSGGSVSDGGSSAGGLTGSGGSGNAGVAGLSTTGGSGDGGFAGMEKGVCDIFAGGNTPCVAAHSTVRALYAEYDGNLYQVTRASDKTTKDIGVLSAGSFADSAVQDAFCSGTTCLISIIYDQSGKNNHLRQGTPGQHGPTPDNEADAAALKLKLSGHSVYGVHLPVGYGYRVDKTTGVATADQPETEYMVTSGTFFNGSCCFDYGNAETDNHADGAGTMEAVYFGNYTHQGKGAGAGPWVMADMENGVYAGPSFAANPMDTPLVSPYVTAMVIGRSGSFALRGGDAQNGLLKTMYDGARPKGYDPMKKQGAIVLGVGGDNTPDAQGNFFEGVLTSGAASTATTDAIQANIVAAGYGM